MPHSLIIGMTGSGKTTLATRFSVEYRRRGVKVIVLDPMIDPRWQADYITSDRYQFLAVLQHPDTKSCAVFVDESAEMIGHYKQEMFWLATRGRHLGHNCHFICQRAKQLAPTVRDQCEHLFMFNCSLDDAKELANEFAKMELREAPSLAKGEYFYAPRWGATERRKVF